LRHITTIGLTGDPTFILAQSYTLIGAQSSAEMADSISKVAKEMA
jgi:predicted DsbA family dithiol-disulfide isomerase